MNHSYPDPIGTGIFSREIPAILFRLAMGSSDTKQVTACLWDYVRDFEIYPVFAPPKIASPAVDLDVAIQADLTG